MVTVLKGGMLIDGMGSDPVSPAVLVIDGERIAGAGKEGGVDIPAGAEVIDVRGKTMLPGLINCHTHLCFDGSRPDMEPQVVDDPPLVVALRASENLRRSLRAGVTTIRDMGEPHGLSSAVEQALRDGVLPGPRFFHAGRIISKTGGHAYWMGNNEADGADGVRKAVREELKAGAAWIKIMASNSAAPEYTMEELMAAVDEAHITGKKITAHAINVQGIRNALQAGIDCLEHAGPWDEEEILEIMIEKGVWLVPTFSWAFLQNERGAEIGMSKGAIEEVRQWMADGKWMVGGEGLEPLIRAAKAGLKMAMGTDAGSPAVPHDEVVREIELFCELGVCRSPMDAIVISTRNGAELLGMEKELGTLEQSKLADILVVDGDPLTDLGALRDVHLVFLGGKMMVRDGLVL